MKRVLITGSTGLLGSSLTPWLKAQGFEIWETARGLTGPQAADLTQPSEVRRVLDASRPDCIMNLAAMTNVDACERSPAQAYLANAGVVLNLARWIETSDAGCRLVQISTDQLYDGPGPHAETTVVPLNYYAYSKCLAEEYVRRVGGVCLRTNFFGRSRRAGRASLSDWIVESVRARRAITVFDDVLFSPLSIDSLVAMMGAVLRSEVAGVFNLGSRQGMSKADFATGLVRAAGLDAPQITRGSVTERPQVALRPLDMRMDVSAFEKAFNVSLPTLEEEIASVGQEYRHAAG